MSKNNQKPFAVVTGASQGLGRSYALQLAQAGHNLIITSMHNDGLPALADRIIKEYNVAVEYREVDLTKLDELKELIANIKEHYQVDILINNAGIGAACAFGDESIDFLDKMFNLNMRAVSILCHGLLPLLEAEKQAYILNVSSMIAFSPSGYKSIYPASKSYVHNFSLCLREELKPKGISVSVVYPGAMKTNKFIKARIEKHNALLKSGVIPTDIIAKTSLRKMFLKKRIIIVGWPNSLMRILMQLTPAFIKIPLLTNAMKKEVLATTTDTEIS